MNTTRMERLLLCRLVCSLHFFFLKISRDYLVSDVLQGAVSLEFAVGTKTDKQTQQQLGYAPRLVAQGQGSELEVDTDCLEDGIRELEHQDGKEPSRLVGSSLCKTKKPDQVFLFAEVQLSSQSLPKHKAGGHGRVELSQKVQNLQAQALIDLSGRTFG
mmetsp:Transcript_38767/g.50116  ORF Transcript_38767/g.50116 Transcript_38767/m.50116 type:complete len:159 (-) Transcript_38767:3177-3653(-)